MCACTLAWWLAVMDMVCCCILHTFHAAEQMLLGCVAHIMRMFMSNFNFHLGRTILFVWSPGGFAWGVTVGSLFVRSCQDEAFSCVIHGYCLMQTLIFSSTALTWWLTGWKQLTYCRSVACTQCGGQQKHEHRLPTGSAMGTFGACAAQGYLRGMVR